MLIMLSPLTLIQVNYLIYM